MAPDILSFSSRLQELVRTKTLTKSMIVQIDAVPFRQWYESYYGTPLGRKKGVKLTEAEEAVLNRKRSAKSQKKIAVKQRRAKVEQGLEEQFQAGRVLACIASRPGQIGRCDGYVLEGKELDFYMKKIKQKKSK